MKNAIQLFFYIILMLSCRPTEVLKNQDSKAALKVSCHSGNQCDEYSVCMEIFNPNNFKVRFENALGSKNFPLVLHSENGKEEVFNYFSNNLIGTDIIIEPNESYLIKIPKDGYFDWDEKKGGVYHFSILINGFDVDSSKCVFTHKPEQRKNLK